MASLSLSMSSAGAGSARPAQRSGGVVGRYPGIQQVDPDTGQVRSGKMPTTLITANTV
jgi:hypothetical protein